METLDDFLAHHGIRGMKWGVRRSNPSSSSGPQEVVVKTKPGKAIKTSGGGGHSPSEEAIAKAAITQKAKASQVHSLSNKELQLAITRMNLEKNYRTLTAPTGAKAFIKKLFGTEVAAIGQGKTGPIVKQVGVALAAQSAGKHRK